MYFDLCVLLFFSLVVSVLFPFFMNMYFKNVCLRLNGTDLVLEW